MADVADKIRYIVFLLDGDTMPPCIKILIFVYSASAMEKICKEHLNTVTVT